MVVDRDKLCFVFVNSKRYSTFTRIGWLMKSAESEERIKSKDRIGIMKFWPPNFRRLVLFCMDSYDSESRRIFQHFSRSTRLAYFCTAQTSKFHKKISHNFAKLKIEISIEISDFLNFFMKNAISHRNFDEILSGFREHVPKIVH